MLQSIVVTHNATVVGVKLVERAQAMLLDNVVHKHSIELANVYDLHAQISASMGKLFDII